MSINRESNRKALVTRGLMSVRYDPDRSYSILQEKRSELKKLRRQEARNRSLITILMSPTISKAKMHPIKKVVKQDMYSKRSSSM